MSFLERYKKGETVEVYSEIASLGQSVFSENHIADVRAVVIETMERTACNLTVIHNELRDLKYNFKRKIHYSFEAPLNKPNPNVNQLLVQLENCASPFGFVPFSLQVFYQIVGSCNLTWDYETDKNIWWEGADPIQVLPLEAIVEEVADDYWREEMTDGTQENGSPYLELSADYLHKDNVSGGPAYSIEITPRPSIDGNFINECHQTTFINYLRIIFENGGFGRTKHLEKSTTFQSFRERVLPQLRKI